MYNHLYFDVYNNSNFIPNKYLINKKKVDVKIFSLQKFIQLCSKADTNALDLLFSWTNKDTESYLYAVSDYINPMAQIITYKKYFKRKFKRDRKYICNFCNNSYGSIYINFRFINIFL